MKGVEPPPRLIDRFGNKASRKFFMEKFPIFKRIMELGKRHGTRIKPAVNDFRHSPHFLAALRTPNHKPVNVGTMQFHRKCRLVAGQFRQFLPASHRKLMATALAFPDV